MRSIIFRGCIVIASKYLVICYSI